MFKVWHSLHVGGSWELIEEGFNSFDQAQDLSVTHWEYFTGNDSVECNCSICDDGSFCHSDWRQSYIVVVTEGDKEPKWVEDQVINTAHS